MTPERRKRLEAAGWKVGSTKQFLKLSDEEAALVELKLSLAAALRAVRAKKGLTQSELAKRMRSSQSRVAKIEGGDPTVSLDLIARALLIAGARPEDLRKAFTAELA